MTLWWLPLCPPTAVTAGRYPIDLAPSRDSRMMSAWPACWTVSAITCSSTRRADQRAPGSNQGAGGNLAASPVAGSVGCAIGTVGWCSNRLGDPGA